MANNNGNGKSLESWIWDAACSIRGAKDAPKYKDYILPLIFTKRLCDVFDDELNRIAAEVGSRKKAFQLARADHKLVRFYLPLVPDDPEQPVWSVIRKLADKIGEGVTTHMRSIARVNRPYENEAREMVKPHGFVLDFVGIFDKLEKALAFDSDEINAIVKDLKLLKVLFKNKMERFQGRADFPVRLGEADAGWKTRAPFEFDDKDVDTLIEHFRDPARRKEFFKEYKEIEMLYEIISPDAFLRPFISDYGTLSAIYAVVRKAYAKQVMVDRDFQRKTNALVQRHIGTSYILPVEDTLKINEDTVKYIVDKKGGDNSKVINLVKSIGKAAEEQSDDPYLIAMAERARVVQEAFEDRQATTAETLAKLLREVEANEARKKEQAAKGIDGLTFFVYRMLEDAKIGNAEAVSRKIREAFVETPNWKRSDNQLRELRKKVTFSIFAECDDLDAVTTLVNDLFRVLEKADRI